MTQMSSSIAEDQQPLPPIGIAVMGATGSGKTSFINIASGSQLRVGTSLESCTDKIEVANEFTLDGRQVILIDTPGFDDTNLSDTEVLSMIALFLATTYKTGAKLSGIIYMHRISDERFTGVSVRNFRMFRQLCGDPTLKNVVIVTNMWGKVTQDVGEARERELVSKHFKAALDKGAQLAPHDNTSQSSYDVIRRIMKNDPAVLQIQREIVDEGKSISNTAAGEVAREEIDKLMKRHETEVQALREELRCALESQDEETKLELEEATRELKEQMEQMKAESEAMVSRFNEEKQRVDEMVNQMKQTQGNTRRGVELFNGDWSAHVVWHIARICQQADHLGRRLRNLVK